MQKYKATTTVYLKGKQILVQKSRFPKLLSQLFHAEEFADPKAEEWEQTVTYYSASSMKCTSSWLMSKERKSSWRIIPASEKEKGIGQMFS